MEKTTEAQKKRWIKYIQTGRRTLRLSDDVYITILLNTAGVDSSSKITSEQQFLAVKRALSNAGFGTAKETKRSAAYSFITAVKNRAKNVLGVSWQTRIHAYLQKSGLPALDKCTDFQLRSVMGFLSRVEAMERKKNEKKQ